MNTKIWTTYEGKKIPYNEIQDTHLANIIHHLKSCYGSKETSNDMLAEANARGLSSAFLNKAPYPFKNKNGETMISKDGSIQKVDERELAKEKFRNGIEKRKQEEEAEKAYWDTYYKGRQEMYSKFDLMNEVYQEEGYLDGFSANESDWFLNMIGNRDFMHEYKIWKDEFIRKLDEEDHGPYAKKIIKPLDRPELHQAIKEGMNMCLSTKAVNKLNGLKVGEEKFVELTQASSEAKTITVDLVSLLQGTEQFKGLKLGKDALLKAVDFSGDSLSVKLSLGTVSREENAMMTAALIQLVNQTKV